MMRAVLVLLASVLLTGAGPQDPVSDISPEVRAVLTRNLRFTTGDLSSLQRGQFVARNLDARASGEVALVATVRAYVTGGPSRMLQYDDGPTPIRPVDEFDGILANAPSIGALVAGLPDHLLNFPANRTRASQDFLYWSKEKFGPSPFITVTHVTMTESTSSTSVVTPKAVYSSRHLDASLW